MAEIVLLALMIGLIGYWWNAVSAKEIARLAGKQKCAQLGVQFLDDTVMLSKIRFCRNDRGRLQFCRTYHFEFSSDWETRYKGRVLLAGERILAVETEAYRVPYKEE